MYGNKNRYNIKMRRRRLPSSNICSHKRNNSSIIPILLRNFDFSVEVHCSFTAPSFPCVSSIHCLHANTYLEIKSLINYGGIIKTEIL